MHLHTTGFARREDGASAVEFALVVPLVILFVCGILAVAQIYSDSSALDAAVGKAGRLITLDEKVSPSDLAASIKSNLDVTGSPAIAVTYTHSKTRGVAMANLSASMTRTYTLPLVGDYHMTFTSQTSVPTN